MFRNCTYLFLILFSQISFGQIGFEENIIIDSSNYQDGVRDVVASDIDNDGDMDIIVASYFDTKIAWYENIDGQGTFSFAKTISTSVDGPYSVNVTDIDNDGDMDVLSASRFDDKIAWFENLDGQGTFGPEQIISTTADEARSVYSADIDGDGDMDVVSASFRDDKIAWYENIDGQGVFGAEQIISTIADGAESVYSSDIDGDGDMDVISASYFDDKIAWYENTDGLGTFSAEQVITLLGDGASSVQSSDMDGDGDMDVISASFNDNKIAWYENTDGQGNFAPQIIISNIAVEAVSVYSSDIDGDGDKDVLSASRDRKIAWYENLDGEGTFGPQEIVDLTTSDALSVFVEDIDNDGQMDIVSGSWRADYNIAWYRNTDGQGTFEKQIITSSAEGAISVRVCDIDGDGDEDIISASNFNNNISWYENNNGQGSFNNQHIISAEAPNPSSIFTSDIDGDGDMDILASFNQIIENPDIVWYENTDGQGTFGTMQVISDNADFAGSVCAGDIDADGDMDVLSASKTDDKIAWYENLDGMGTFGPEQIITNLADGAESVFAIDIDGDTDLDVISASVNEDKIAWYENTDGQGSFGPEQIIALPSLNVDVRSIYSTDLDGDGDADVLAAQFTADKIIWHENLDGLGTFGPEQIITNLTDGAQSVYATDLDGDGDPDVLSASSSDDKIAWYENIDGQGNFGQQQILTTSADGATSVYAGYINGDGAIDVLSASSVDDKIAWYKNLGAIKNEINGYVTFDLNMDGCNSGELPAENLLIATSNGTDEVLTVSSSNGFYQLFVDEGNFSTSILNLPTQYTSNPISQDINFSGVGNTETIHFCIQPIATVNDLKVSIYPSLNEPRPGFDTTYHLVYSNRGTTQLSGDIQFEFDNSKIQFLSASQMVASQSINSLVFSFTDLQPLETRFIDLEFNVFPPPTTNIDDVLVSTATINPIAGDETEEDNVFELEQTVIGSYDPNDITCLQGEEVFIEDANKFLNYLIRFQNTGTASAINVRVEHILDDKLDWSTMQLESLSHSGRVEIENGTDISFIFNDINLPDSTNDEPNSHGYIAFKIKPKQDVVVGDIISGVADIYFDFNPPIVTNTATTEFVEPLSTNDYEVQSFQIYPIPVIDKITVSGKSEIDTIAIFDINGRSLNQQFSIKNYNQDTILDISQLKSGIYFIELQSGNSKQTTKFIKK